MDTIHSAPHRWRWLVWRLAIACPAAAVAAGLVAALAWEAANDPSVLRSVESYLGVVLPLIYVGGAYAILFARSRVNTAVEWPAARCAGLVLWGLLTAQSWPFLDETAHAYVTLCWAMDAIFLSRLLVARVRNERSQEWKGYGLFLIWWPFILHILLPSLKAWR